MKKVILISFLFVLAMPQSVFSQFQLDISTGINQSDGKYKFLMGLPVNPESRTGYFISLSPNFRLNKKTSLLIDFQYNQKGFSEEIIKNKPAEFRFSYLDIIPEIEFKVSNFLTLRVGGSYGFRIKDESWIVDRGWEESLSGNETSNDRDIGLTFKAKVNYKKMFVFLRYTSGVKNVNGNREDIEEVFEDIFSDAKLLNKNLQIGIGYSLFKKKQN